MAKDSTAALEYGDSGHDTEGQNTQAAHGDRQQTTTSTCDSCGERQPVADLTQYTLVPALDQTPGQGFVLELCTSCRNDPETGVTPA